VTGLTDSEREALWDAIERAFLDTTTWDRASEDAIDDAVEALLADRLAAHEAREAELIAALEAGDACGAVGCRALAERDALAAAVDRVRARHAPLGTTLVATADDLLGSNWRDVEPDSFEEITSRDEVCMACAGYPTWPCPTARALDGDA